MAGSGKTTLMAQLQRSLNLNGARTSSSSSSSSSSDAAVTVDVDMKELSMTQNKTLEEGGNAKEEERNQPTTITTRATGYAINLDPAAKYIPFTSSIDM